MSTRGVTRRAAPELPKDWEDEYHRLKSKYDDLKVEFNDKEQHNKLLQAKIMKLGNDMALMDRQMGTTRADKEEQGMIESLQELNNKLKAQTSAFGLKNKTLTEQLEKKKRELTLARRPTAGMAGTVRRSGTAPMMGRPEVEIVAGPSSRTSAMEPMAAPVDGNWMEIARKLKARLASAEDQLAQLKEEGLRLRANGNNAGKGLSSDADNMDLKWRLQQLQTQYDYLTSKTAAQLEAHKHGDVKMDEYQTKVRELRRSLEELQHEKAISDAKAMRVESLENQVGELRASNRSLEDKITRLCEAPFISDAFGLHETKMRYEDLAREREDLLAKVEHLQEAVRTHFSALTSLKQQCAASREEKEAADKIAEGLRLQLQDMTAGQNLMQDQLRLYSGDDGVDVATLERALTMVKRASEPLGKLPFLEDPEGERLVSLPAVKRKLREYEELNLKLTEENERLESLLRLQTGISNDLHKEVEALVRTRDKDKRELEHNVENFKEVAMKRQDKIHELEAQVREFVYGLAKGGKGSKGKAPIMVSPDKEGPEEEDEDNALLHELIEDRGGTVREDENLMEVWVKSATLREGVLTPGSSAFVVIDFFDYESQTTSLLSGLKPQWDFAATYRITVDDFLLRYLATDTVTLELNMASQGGFTMLARCSVPLSGLLRARPRLQLVNHPMVSVKTGQVIANITLDVRLALPLSELFRLFLERNPNEKRYIEEIASQRVVDAEKKEHNLDVVPSGMGKEEVDRLYNELEVIVHRANALPNSADQKPPSAYVHFQLMGFPHKVTNPVVGTGAPEFNERFTFPMTTLDRELLLMQRTNLQLSVIDVKGMELDMADEGLIGEVYVKLASLAEGSAITDTFNVKNAEGKQVGELYITLRWKYPLRKQRDLGPLALSGVDVEILIDAFSYDELQKGVIDYKAFCRFIDPPPQVLRSMEALRKFCGDITDKEGRSPREIFKVLIREDEGVDEEQFVQRMLKTHLDLLPMDFVNLFKFIDTAGAGRVSLDQFLAVLNLDEISGLPALLQNKLRERSKDLVSRGIPPVKLFEAADTWGADGLVKRSEFKSVLKRMGFALVDDVDPIRDVVEAEPSKRRGVNVIEESEDVLNDTIGSEDNILHQADGTAGAGVGPVSKGVDAVMRQQREIFEGQRAEFQQRSQAALAQEKAAGGAGGAAGGSEGVNLLARSTSQTPAEIAADPFRDGADHQVGTTSADIGRPRDLDAAAREQFATKLQSLGRGFLARKSPSPPQKNPQEQPYAQLEGGVSILNVENILYAGLKSLTHDQPLPDLAAGFLKVDQRRTGLVNRKQFAHVLGQYPAVELYGADLRAAMDFFDVSGDGTSLDYNAFLRFFNYRDPELLPAILKLQTMTLRKNAYQRLRELDQSGAGFVSRADIVRCLAEMGYGVMSQSVMQTMLQLFETRQDGLVRYQNFFEYVRESDLTQKLEAASVQLFQLVTGGALPVDPRVRDWFALIDKPNNGKFVIQQLAYFLTEQAVYCTKETVVAMFSQMDPGGTGATFGDFTNWLVEFGKSTNDLDAQLSLYTPLSMGELQRKAHQYVLAVASSTIGTEMLADSFLVYDWRRSDAGAIAKPLFVRAIRRAGFPFTMNELRTITGEFSLANKGEVVSYKGFLSWATPPNKALMAIGIAEEGDTGALGPGLTNEDNGEGKQSAGRVARFLEKAMMRGQDLQTLFRRYDTHGVGRITSTEFCAALSDLGLQSLTQREALELGDRYRATVGDFILYRRICGELLRHADEVSGAADVDPVEVLRGALQASRVDLRRLRDVLEYYDRKGNGNVRREDLATIFDECKMKIKRTEVEAVADKYSMGDSDWVNYLQLMRAMESRMTERSSVRRSAQGQGVSDELSTKVKSLIETLIIRGKDYRAEMDKFDDQFSGAILQADFREAMTERLRAGLTPKELETLEKTYRYANDPRKLNFVKMIHTLHPHNFGRVSFLSADNGEPWEIAELLRQKIRRRCDYVVPGALRGPFKHFARSGDRKTVSREEFSVACRNLGMRLASDQESAVFDIVNLGGKKAFPYNDFVVFVCDPQHLDIVWKLRRAIARARVSEKEIINALNEKDSNASGLITATQFLRAMRNCSIELTDSDAVRLMLRFDVEDNQHFDLDRFFRFLRGKQLDEEGLDDLNDFDLAVSKRLADETVTARRSAEATETHSWSSLKRRVEEKLEVGYTGSEVFAWFDRDLKGTLDVAALVHGVQRLGLTLTNAEARSMLRRMSVLAGGTVNKASFFSALGIDLRVFAVDNRDLVGGETGRRRRPVSASASSAYDDEESESRRRRPSASAYGDEGESHRRPSAYDEDEPPRSAGGGGFSALVGRIREQMEVAVNPRDRSDLPAALRRALDKLSFQKPGFITHRELSRAFESLGVRVANKEIIKTFQVLDQDELGLLPHEDLIGSLFGAGARKGRADDAGESEVAVALRKRPDLLEEVVTQLRAVESQRDKSLHDLLDEFRRADYDKSGTLGKADFASALGKFGLLLRAGMERDLVDSLTQNAKQIKYADFVDALKRDVSADSVVDDVILRLRKRISRDGKHGQEVEEIFSGMDRDGDGQVDVYEFESALEKLGIPLSRDEAKRIVARFSVNGTSIKYKEFLKAFHTAVSGGANSGSGKVSSQLRDDTDAIIATIRRKLEDYLGPGSNSARRMKEVFAEMDRDRSGKIDKREFEKAMSVLRVDLSRSDLELLFERIDPDRNGLDYTEFIAMLGFRASSRTISIRP